MKKSAKKHFLIVRMSIYFALAAAFIWSVFIEPAKLNQQNFTKENWPAGSIRIAFFSDLHAGSPHINKNYIQNLISRINAMNSDIVLIGGDLVINGVLGGEAMDIEEVASLLNKLNAPLGKFVVLGNHDWWNDGPRISKVLNENGFVVLENQSQLITLKDSSKFWLIGIGDHFTEHADPVKAFKSSTIDYPKLVFMHDPGAIFEIKEKYFLSLAGHMHGGQVFIPGYGAIITPGTAPKSWAQGWIDFELGSIYVTKGIGTSILPVRFNAPPEFVILDLKNKNPGF